MSITAIIRRKQLTAKIKKIEPSVALPLVVIIEEETNRPDGFNFNSSGHRLASIKKYFYLGRVKITVAKRIASLLVCAALTKLLHAQPRDLRFDHISVEHGLSNFSISSIVQDQQGFLWIATEDGLNKYDGYEFTVYKADRADSNALPTSYIGQLYLDRAGNLWVNAAGRMYRYNPDSDSFERFERFFPNTKNIPDESIIRIFEDRRGDFWIGTNKGLYQYIPTRDLLIQYRHDPDDPTSVGGDFITAFAEDRAGNLWIGTLNGSVNRFEREEKKFKRYPQNRADPDHLGNDCVWSILEDRRGTIWIASERGLYRYDRRPDRFTLYRSDSEASKLINNDRVFVLFEDSQGILWAGTRNLGLWRYEPPSDLFFQYRHDPNDEHSLGGNRIHDISEDRSGVLWFGHYRAGLSRYARRQDKFARYKINSEIYAICEDRNANLWVGGSGTGLMQLDREGKLIAQYRHKPQDAHSLSGDNVLAICEDHTGSLWIGTNEGVNLYDSKQRQFIRYKHKPPDPANAEQLEVKIIYEDSKGELWIGTKGSGLLRFDRGSQSFTYYQPDDKNPKSLSGTQVWAIREDQNGDLWVGTFGGGLNHFDRNSQTFTHYPTNVNPSDTASHPTIYSLHIDSEGCVWIGTFAGGLQRLDPRTKRFSHYTDRSGLIDNFVKGILSDDRGNLWLSTDKGLSRFDPRSETFKSYKVQDGLISNVLLSGAHFKSKDGRLYFGGEGGFVAFYPDSLKDNPPMPQVAITRFNVFDKPLPFSSSISALKQIKLSYKQNFFSFEFVSFDYTDPLRNEYAHKLEGFDHDWIHSGTRRYASYTNVDPGEYVFLVRAANSDGVWNETGAEIKIIVTPPFWKTWWFRALAAAIIIATVFGVYRYRVNHLLEMERLRTRIAADLHDEIAGNLSSIAMFGKIVQDEAASAGEKTSAKSQILDRIIGLSQDSVTSIREIIWAIDPKPETIHDLLLRVHDLAVNSCRAQNIILKFDVPQNEKLPQKNLSPEQRKHLWLLLKEAITNAIKHSRATELSVSVHHKSGSLSISIADNGVGINSADGSGRFSGKGLGTMKSRAEQLSGSFEVQSGSEGGTTVTAVVKI